jgi:glycine/D-amino acid oxidase-like deaminating enzyme
MVTNPAQDFVISSVPELEGLFVAAGGSFHGWKFLPNIGRYVVQMIEGTLSSAWSELWRIGGTPSENPIHLEVMPVRPFI